MAATASRKSSPGSGRYLYALPMVRSTIASDGIPSMDRAARRVSFVAGLARSPTVLSLGCHPARSHVLGPGVEPGLLSRGDGADFRRRHRIGDAPLVGYVGRVEPLKGVLTLVEAMRIVWTRQPAAHLLIAGPRSPAGSPEEQAWSKAVEALSEAERGRVVRLDGFDEADKASLLAALDVLAMPSVVESFGLTYLEAWACRKPVVGARVAAVECVVDHGVDGLLVRPHDRDETAAAISALLSDPGLRERMGTAGHGKVMARFCWEPIVDAVEALYRDLAGAGEPGKRRPAGPPCNSFPPHCHPQDGDHGGAP